MAYVLGARSLKNLEGVHPDLATIVKRAIQVSEIDFTVTEGVRTLARQRELVAAGASRTMNSRHLKADNGYGHAVDLAALIGGAVRWDWPLYGKLNLAMQSAADYLGLAVEWGGDWRQFRDGPHWQLPWARYPG